MKINWKVRIRNKNFWLALIPALLLLVQVVAAPFGYKWDFGVVTDPTTAGTADSARAMTYTEPRQDDTRR